MIRDYDLSDDEHSSFVASITKKAQDELVTAFIKCNCDMPEFIFSKDYILSQLILIPDGKRNELFNIIYNEFIFLADEKNRPEIYANIAKSVANRILAMYAAHKQRGRRGPNISDAIVLFEQRRYGEALTSLKFIANSGDARAKLYVGRCYLNGLGCNKDTGAGVNWIKEAADEGNPEAQVEIGDMYYYGSTIDANTRLAGEYYSKAAKQENELAMRRLEKMHASIARRAIITYSALIAIIVFLLGAWVWSISSAPCDQVKTMYSC